MTALKRATLLDGKERPLTFIFHDATRGNAGTNKAAINSHIAKTAHNQRKERKVLQYRQHGILILHCPQDARAAVPAATYPRPSEYLWAPSPHTLLRKGGSDPFNVYAITITPTVNMLLTYARDYYIPATNRDAANPQSSDSHRSRQWAGYVSFLQDECTAFAYLTQVVAAMPPGRLQHQKKLNLEALSFKVKSIELLRQRLMKSTKDATTHCAMVILMGAAVYDAHTETAKHHTVMLAQFFQTSDTPTDHLLIFEAMFRDNQRAAESLTRPFFDVEGWISNTFAPLFDSLIDSLPEFVTIEAAGKDVDSSLDDLAPRGAMIHAKHILLVFLLCMRDPTYSTPLHFFYMRYMVAVSINKLLNTYMDSLRSFEAEDNRARLWARVQAYTSLVSVVWIRTVAKIDGIYISPGFSILKANDKLIAKAKGILIETEEMFTAEAQLQYARIKLWAFYIGAYEEQASQTGENRKASAGWFNGKLDEHAKNMHLTKWDQVRDVFRGFLYTDVLQPHGSVWFGTNGGLSHNR